MPFLSRVIDDCGYTPAGEDCNYHVQYDLPFDDRLPPPIPRRDQSLDAPTPRIGRHFFGRNRAPSILSLSIPSPLRIAVRKRSATNVRRPKQLPLKYYL